MVSIFSYSFGQTTGQNRIEVFEYKNFMGERVEGHSGIAITRKYYKNNKLISIKYFDAKDEPVKDIKKWSKQNFEWRFSYDDKGNFIKQKALDANGDIYDVHHSGRGTIEILEYNNKNQLLKKSSYDKAMNLVGIGDIGNAINEYQYNDKGQLVICKSFDANGELIKNGFCYDKYEYNDDGLLSKHYYYYDEDKLLMFINYTYAEGKLKKEEEFNDKNEKIGFTIYEYENDWIVSKERWFYKWEKSIFEKEQIKLDLVGWKIDENDLEKLNFDLAGEGEYHILIDENGKIKNIEPDGYKGGYPEFNMEIYSKFKNLSLVRVFEFGRLNLEGKISLTFIPQELFTDMEAIYNPKPNF